MKPKTTREFLNWIASIEAKLSALQSNINNTVAYHKSHPRPEPTMRIGYNAVEKPTKLEKGLWIKSDDVMPIRTKRTTETYNADNAYYLIETSLTKIVHYAEIMENFAISVSTIYDGRTGQVVPFEVLA